MSQLTFTPLLLILLLFSHASCHGESDHHSSSSSSPPSPYPNLRSRSLIHTKLFSALIVFAGTFLGGISPCFLKWNPVLLSAGTQFAGGVFLSTAMIHFLSDSNETFTHLTSISYPFASMLACAGYLITMLADCLLSFKSRRKDSEVEAVVAELGEEEEEGRDGFSERRVGDAIVMITALCFHSIFEGIAIGVGRTAGDVWRTLWTVCIHKIFAAVAMGIAVMEMMPKKRGRLIMRSLGYSFAFSISTPVGVGIGILIDATTEGAVADWVYAISMGIACGVFINVSINHLIMVDSGASLVLHLRRIVAVSFGVGLIAVVMIWDT